MTELDISATAQSSTLSAQRLPVAHSTGRGDSRIGYTFTFLAIFWGQAQILQVMSRVQVLESSSRDDQVYGHAGRRLLKR